MVKRISEGTLCLSWYIIPIIFKILEAILFMCEYHFKCLCIVNPKKLNSSFDIFHLYIWYIDLFLRHMKYHEFFFMLIENLFNFNQSAIFVNSIFKFLEI